MSNIEANHEVPNPIPQPLANGMEVVQFFYLENEFTSLIYGHRTWCLETFQANELEENTEIETGWYSYNSLVNIYKAYGHTCPKLATLIELDKSE